jgi:KDO2-lipid IV(A) lauroyltransferase
VALAVRPREDKVFFASFFFKKKKTLLTSLGHHAEALAVRAGLALLRALGPVRASNFAGGVARILGRFIPASKTADKNLAMALPALTAAERRKIIGEVWENMGRTVGELVHLGSLKQTASGPGFHITGWEHMEAAMAQAPCLIFTGHIGNWEIPPLAALAHGVEVAFMYRAASNPLVDKMILGLRQAAFHGRVKMFPKGAVGAMAAYRHVSKGGVLGFLNDQKLDNGIAVPFFGRDAMTAPALASFALKMHRPVVPVYVVREAPARLHVIFEPALPMPASGNREADILALTTSTNECIERWVRERPGAWLWLHRRWPKGAC